MSGLDNLLGLLADAAWLEGWIGETHPNGMAHLKSMCVRDGIGRLIDAEAKRIGLELDWQQSEEYLEGGRRE